MRKPIHGILLLDKPDGMTSNGALQRVKRLFNAKKAGHTGSLDPIATGMLPLCFGEATKFSQFLLDSDKSYHVVAKLGEQTTTGDREGPVIVTQPIPADLTAERIDQAMATFLGEGEQIPPMFSAIKFQGKPLYELARKGIEIERKARRIVIHSLVLEQVEPDSFTFRVHCSKGTYIRTLVEDIARAFNCVAHVQELRRLSVTPYADATMYTLAQLEHLANTTGPAGLTACLLPVETAISIYPAIKLSTSAAFYLRMGQSVRATCPQDQSLLRLVTEDGRFIGVGESTPEGCVKPIRLLSTQEAAASF